MTLCNDSEVFVLSLILTLLCQPIVEIEEKRRSETYSTVSSLSTSFHLVTIKYIIQVIKIKDPFTDTTRPVQRNPSIIYEQVYRGLQIRLRFPIQTVVVFTESVRMIYYEFMVKEPRVYLGRSHSLMRVSPTYRK